MSLLTPTGMPVQAGCRGKPAAHSLYRCVGCGYTRRRAALITPGEFVLDQFQSAGAREFVSHANAVVDGIVVRGAMADNTHPAHAQQRSAAVFGVVQAAAEFVERAPRQQRAHLRRYSARERLA